MRNDVTFGATRLWRRESSERARRIDYIGGWLVNFVLTMMNFAFKMMNFGLKLIDFVFTMMILMQTNRDGRDLGLGGARDKEQMAAARRWTAFCIKYDGFCI